MYFHFLGIMKAILIQVFLVFLRLEVNSEMGRKLEPATGRLKPVEMAELRVTWAGIQTSGFPNWKQ
jgi:hypothetical protein